jgi:transposase
METTIGATFLAEISEEDWANTPEKVKALVKKLLEQVVTQETEYEHFKEQAQRNSQNSSQPPSQDISKGFQSKDKPKSDKPRGAQFGHPGHQQSLYPLEQCKESYDYYPEHCCECGHGLSGKDESPLRCQIIDIPPLKPEVIEHRFHALECPCCGVFTRAHDVDIVDGSRYGARLCALVGLLSGEYRQSHRMVVKLLSELFEIELSVGSVGKLRQEMSQAVAEPVAEAQEYVRTQASVSMDETSFTQGNGDGNNPGGTKGWIWVVVTPWVCYFQVWLSRAQEAAQSLLGATFSGIVNSDRCGSYNWIPLEQRQLCWAHLKRDFTKIAERNGVSGELGKALLENHKQLFNLLHQLCDGTLERTQFIVDVDPIRQQVKDRLSQAATCEILKGDQSAWAKTVRTCRQLLKVEPALWLFVTVEGIESTNNAAEQAIRPAVLWRRCSYGSQSAAGSLFVGRMMTVVTTLRRQQRSVLDYLADACRAKRQWKPAPSLLPDSNLNNVAVLVV